MREAAAAIVCCLAACGAAPAEVCPAGPGTAVDRGVDATPASMILGSSITDFTPLTDGGSLGVHQGPQLGFHVYLTLRARGVAPGVHDSELARCSPLLTFTITDEVRGVRIDAFAPLRFPLVGTGAEEPGAFQLEMPRQVPLRIRTLAEVEGHTLRVRAAVDDADGVHAEASVVVTARAAR